MLPGGSELYVIGKDDTLGAFTPEINNKASRKFATTPLAGDSVIIEYHEPFHNKNSGKSPALRISKIVHGFRATPFAYGASDSVTLILNVARMPKRKKSRFYIY